MSPDHPASPAAAGRDVEELWLDFRGFAALGHGKDTVSVARLEHHFRDRAPMKACIERLKAEAIREGPNSCTRFYVICACDQGTASLHRKRSRA